MSMFPSLNDANPESLKAWARQLVAAIDRAHVALGGGTVTLTASATETIVSDQLAALGGTVVITPQTANAAAALATTFVVIGQGKFTITHASDTTTDRTFFYAVIEPDSDPVSVAA